MSLLHKLQVQNYLRIQSTVSLCREFGGSKGAAVQKLIETYGLSKEKAEEQADLFWVRKKLQDVKYNTVNVD